MYLKKHRILGGLTALVISGSMLGGGVAMAQEVESQEAESTAGAEVLTRGPIHEAFAGTVSFNPEAGIIIDQAPPMLIEEVPPEHRLEGENVAWIPGYWAWDEEESDFLWISGIWRNLPPGREWVPGYWTEIEGRHQWTSGYWEDVETTEVTYLPEPPKSVEAGPNIEASSNDQTWIPGNWVYRNDNYAWRAGYWVDARPNWSWTPSYYRWTTRGHVYVDGYWDYPVVRRGVVFAPVRFNRGYIARPGYYYSPSTVIALSVFSNHLFLRPNYGHYYFGDYYEPRYRDRGYFASFSYNTSRRGYDPIYSHYRWENRNDRNWDRQRRDYFEHRRDHADARPPRTWAALNARSQADRDRGDFAVANRLDRVVSNRGEGRQRFQAVNKQERERFVSQRQEIRKFGKERQQLETSGARAKAGDKAQASRVKVNRSPVMAKKSARSDKEGGPPARLQPRMSDKDQEAGNGANNGKGSQADRQGQGNANKNGAASREGQGRNNDKPKPATETRTKPGEKRQANPEPKRQANPEPKRQANPEPKRQANPEPKRQANPEPKRQANPEPKRQANPEPKRQANPTPKRKANPTPKRQADPQPERKGKKAGQNNETSSKPAQKANRQATAQKAQVKKAQPQPQQAARQQPKKAAQQTAAQPKKAAANQPKKAQAASKPAAKKELTAAERRKKRQQAE